MDRVKPVDIARDNKVEEALAAATGGEGQARSSRRAAMEARRPGVAHNPSVRPDRRSVIRAWAYRGALLVLRAWWVVRRPRTSGVRCILRDGDRIALVRHTYGDRRWMLPGGRVRRGEAPAAAARREMRRELGIADCAWEEVGTLAARDGYRRRSSREAFRRHTTHYLAAGVPADALRVRRGEVGAAGWFALEALPADRSDAVDVARAHGWLERRS